MNNFILMGELIHIYEDVIIINVDNEHIKVQKNDAFKNYTSQMPVKEGSFIGIRGEIKEGQLLYPKAITALKEEPNE